MNTHWLEPLAEPSWVLWPVAGHLLLLVGLYAWLTVERLFNVRSGRGRYDDLVTPGGDSGRAARISANLSNQFEAPVLFHLLMLVLWMSSMATTADLWFAWIFLAGRLLHTGVQTLTRNVPLRGLVFSINFGALGVLWAWFLVRAL